MTAMIAQSSQITITFHLINLIYHFTRYQTATYVTKQRHSKTGNTHLFRLDLTPTDFHLVALTLKLFSMHAQP